MAHIPWNRQEEWTTHSTNRLSDGHSAEAGYAEPNEIYPSPPLESMYKYNKTSLQRGRGRITELIGGDRYYDSIFTPRLV